MPFNPIDKLRDDFLTVMEPILDDATISVEKKMQAALALGVQSERLRAYRGEQDNIKVAMVKSSRNDLSSTLEKLGVSEGVVEATLKRFSTFSNNQISVQPEWIQKIVNMPDNEIGIA